MGRKVIDLTGQRYGRLTVASRAPRGKFKNTLWHCICDCGTEHVAQGCDLRAGKAKSCGCISRERNARDGVSSVTEQKTYTSWRLMRERCLNPKATQFHNHGGRGITICERWMNSFEFFFQDMGRRPEGYLLDRKDLNGNYEPDNCVWVSQLEHARKHRNTRSNHAFVSHS